MKWKATHILTMGGDVPRKVMLNSGCLFSKAEWQSGHATTFTFVNQRLYMAPDSEERRKHPERDVDRMLVTSDYSLKPVGETSSTNASGTPMRKAVTRITNDFKVRIGGKERLVAVTMGPGDFITMRPKGCRASSARVLPLSESWALAARLEAQLKKRQRQENRKKAS